MTTNIAELIQINLEYPPLQKIDPNIQEIKKIYLASGIQKLAQAGIPAVLAALYKFSKTDEGAAKIVHTTNHEDWLKIFYSGKEQEAVEKVAHYAEMETDEVEAHMENIADEAIRIVKEHAGSDSTIDQVRTYLKAQRHNILVYLPADLSIGDLLNDDTIDDRTNKMEGPISNFMHKIENKFAGGGGS